MKELKIKRSFFITMIGKKFDYTIKTVVVGDSGVGKTCLLVRFIRDFFNESTQPTLGVDFLSKIVDTTKGRHVELQLWDTAGQELFRSVTRGYYRGSVIGYLIFDLTSKSSFENIGHWLKDIKDVAPPKIVTVLIGNKKDLKDKICVSEEEAQAFAEANGMKYFSTSAKTGENVAKAFISCVEEIDQNTDASAFSTQKNENIVFEDIKEDKGGCC